MSIPKEIYVFQHYSARMCLGKKRLLEDHLCYALFDGETRIVEERPKKFCRLLKKNYNGLAKKIINAIPLAPNAGNFIEGILDSVKVINGLPPGLKDYEYNPNDQSAEIICDVVRKPLDQNAISILRAEASRVRKDDIDDSYIPIECGP